MKRNYVKVPKINSSFDYISFLTFVKSLVLSTVDPDLSTFVQLYTSDATTTSWSFFHTPGHQIMGQEKEWLGAILSLYPSVYGPKLGFLDTGGPEFKFLLVNIEVSQVFGINWNYFWHFSYAPVMVVQHMEESCINC